METGFRPFFLLVKTITEINLIQFLKNVTAKESLFLLVETSCLASGNQIHVPKASFRFFDKLKNEIQDFILTFCFYFNQKDEI